MARTVAAWPRAHPLPAIQALERIHAPATLLAEEVGLSAPASLPVMASDWDLNTFGRRHGWRIWLCSPDGSSQRIPSWQAFQQARSDPGSRAFADSLFLQEHIEGTPESLAFAAYQGELLDCAMCIVEETTRGSEWWTNRIETAPAPMVASLAQALKRAHWTGGGALSLVRDRTERRWVLGGVQLFPHGFSARRWQDGISPRGCSNTPREKAQFLHLRHLNSSCASSSRFLFRN